MTLFAIVLMMPFIAAAGGKDIISAHSSERNYISYSIKENSWLSLSGSTNVNSFQCLSEGGSTSGYILTDITDGENFINFAEGDIIFNVSSFDCKNPMISKDMHKALGGGDDSVIGIKLLDARTGGMEWYSESGSIRANVLITINGKSKIQELEILWKRTGGNDYYFEGTADLSMDDFDIDPPSPAMGLVKVKDDIKVDFNYNIQTSQISRID